MKNRTISGYSIVFGVESVLMYDPVDQVLFREIIAPEAVTKELLDKSDILMTMFHDRQTILARSSYGHGTLSYSIDSHGVRFEFEAPSTTEGDKALELIKRGDLNGCSFMFSANRDGLERTPQKDGYVLQTVRSIKSIRDFTIAAHPAYPQTNVVLGTSPALKSWAGQAKELREAAGKILNHNMVWW